MRPPKRNDPADYERIKVYDEFIQAEIDEVMFDETHEFKGRDKSGLPTMKVCEGVRIKFILAGHDKPHYSRWMTYTFFKKGNLFEKYLRHLVAGAHQDMNFDMERLIGMRVKMMWSRSDDGKFDNVEAIRPLGAKMSLTDAELPPSEGQEEPPQVAEDDPPAEVVE